MGLNRRNVLIGLGATVVGGGAVLGTGAFSTVEADRTVTVETSQDTDALVGLQINDNSIAGSSDGTGGDTISFKETDLNSDALTKFEGALTVSDNSNNAGIYVSIDDGSVGSPGSSLIRTSDPDSNDNSGLYFVASDSDTVNDGSDEWLDVTDGSSVNVDVVVNTLGETNSDNPLNGVDSIRVEAQPDDPSPS